MSDATVERGGYFQVGTFPHAWIDGLPRPLEIAARGALVDPDDDVPDDVRTEYTLGANWYFHAHANKISADVAVLRDESRTEPNEVRVRLQWDVTF